MFVATQLWAVIALASSVLSTAVYSNATTCPEPPSIDSGGVFLHPKPGAVLEPSKKHKFTFCTGKYYKVETLSVKWVDRACRTTLHPD